MVGRFTLRAVWVAAALGAPWLVYACSSAPSGVSASTGTGGKTTSTSSHASSSGTTTHTTTTTSGSSSTGAPFDAGAYDAGADCGTVVVEYPLLASPHVPICSQLFFSSNPPTSGPHYPIWSDYQTYTSPVPRGFYLHDEEHGAVVILYNCPTGCDADLANLASFLATLPADPLCSPPVTARITVTPDPLIPTRFAAAAWGFALTSSCFDLEALAPFISAHYAMGPEDFCTDGIDPTAPDSGIPDGCGTGDGG